MITGRFRASFILQFIFIRKRYVYGKNSALKIDICVPVQCVGRMCAYAALCKQYDCIACNL